MPRTTKQLTNTEIKLAKPRDKEFNLSDGNGLALRVKPNGSKQWLFNYYRPYSNKRANISFGSYPEVSLIIARRKRDEARSWLAQDIDPKEKREEDTLALTMAHNNTLEHISTQWLHVKKSEVTANHADKILSSLKLHVFPALGNHPLHKLTAPKVIETLKPIAAKGSLETVKRLSQRLNEIMVYAVNTGLIQTNPLAGISKAFQAPQKQHLPTLKPEQLPDLMKALTRASIKLTTRCLIEWQLHTMVRPSEAAGATWEEIDIANAQWNIPASRMKKKRAHTIPLSTQSLALLKIMQPISGHREYVFPADRNPKRHANNETANVALKRMGFSGILVAHGLRSLASTTLNEQGFDPDIIETALAHIDKNEVRAAYNRAEYLQRRTVMMEWWSQHIESASMGNMSLSSSTLDFSSGNSHQSQIS